MLRVVVFLSFAVLALGSHSQNAEIIKELLKNVDVGGRVSNDIAEDSRLDVEGLVKKYGYPFERHHVVTPDGYILELHRIPHGRDENNTPGKRPAVYLMHGIFCSSADYVLMGPGSGLGYLLAESGFDVWMGNARGTHYSRRHQTLNPNDGKGIYWDYSWDEIGNIDLPTCIDYILGQTGQAALHYIGHSQGTTIFFVMGSLRPDYNKKIISMHAMAPVAYLAHNKNPLFKVMAENRVLLEAIIVQLGLKELAPKHEIFRFLAETFCSDGASTQPICSLIIFSIAGWSPNQHNATMFPVKLGHTPAGASYRQLVHFGQSITEKTFRRYDYGVVENLVKYGTPTPPAYNLTEITAPVYLHYSLKDPFAELPDVERLYKELGGRVYKVEAPEDTFSHVDFIWGISAKKVIFDRLIELMKSYHYDRSL